jgi:DNA-directed RNA polymerase subunit RPC12/RpoP
LKECPNCKKVYGDNDYYCLRCNYPLNKVDENKVSDRNIETLNRHEKAINNPSKLSIEPNSDKISCPYCGSKQVQLVKRGWNIMTGFFGSGKNERVCMKCLKKY